MKRPAFTFASAAYGLGLMLAALPRLEAQLPDQSVEAHRIEGESILEWFAYEGRTYFIQISDDLDPLQKWIWAPVIETGNDEPISYEFGSTAPRGFARLQYIDAVPPAGVSLEDWDIDGDGLSNDAEISALKQTNPLSDDTDGDGLKDGWEIANGLDPTDNGSGDPDNGFSGDPDGDGSSNFDEQAGATDPASDQQHPPQLLSVDRRAIHYFNDPTGSKWTRYGANWMEFLPDEDADAELSQSQLVLALEQRCPFPVEPPDEADKRTAGTASLSYISSRGVWQDTESSALSAHLDQARYWLKVSPADLEKGPLEFHYLKVSKGTFSPWPSGNPQKLPLSVTVETFKITDSALSAPIDVLPVINPPQANGFTELSTFLVPVGLTVDMNRDGKIDAADQGRATEGHPWRFWVNDDDDSGETGGDDIPLGYNPIHPASDYLNTYVDGIRDFVDFFPVRFELGTALDYFPEADFQYFLKNSPGPTSIHLGFNVVWYPQAEPGTSPIQSTGAGAYLKNIEQARALSERPSTQISSAGMQIPSEMLAAAKLGKGVGLLEARGGTEQPLVVEIRKIDGTPVVEIPLPVKISSVADMFRWKYVLPVAADLVPGDIPGDPPNWPDEDRNGKHFVFVHGYNVSGDGSKGWGAEAFKRMFWSGSNARFSAFAWWGNESQVQVPGVGNVTPNYQTNLTNAFGTAKSFKQYLDLIEGETSVAAHSMGNILVGSAMHDWNARPKNYFMLDSAAAKECYDESEGLDPTQDKMMENLAWSGYPKQLRASEWHKLLPTTAWPSSDWRGKLTWRNRLRGVIDNGGFTDVYNFYSSTEEVLDNPTLTIPESNLALLWLKPDCAWGVQEKRKGLGLTGHVLTSNYGGWKFNYAPFDSEIHSEPGEPGTDLDWKMKIPSEIGAPPASSFLLHLATNPFFDDSQHSSLFHAATGDDTPGSNHARDNRNTLISEMIPCTSFAAGRNSLSGLGGHLGDPLIPGRNVNMEATMKTDVAEWPESNAHDSEEGKPRPWLHSDIKDKSFTHNWKAYQKFTELGQLNSQ